MAILLSLNSKIASTMNMGYGFLRAIYSQKTKKPYAYLKELYGDQMEMHLRGKHIEAPADKSFTEAEWREFRKEIKARVKKENKKRLVYLSISLILTLLVLMVLAWGVKTLLS